MFCEEWTSGDEADHLERVRSAPRAALAGLARGYDWRFYPETALGWIVAQKSIDLDTALSAFFNGGPERFNYLHKRDVPPEFQGACRLLDNICLRINSGFYLIETQACHADHTRIRKWIAVQQIDRQEGTSGRWVFDEAIVQALFAAPEAEVQQGATMPASAPTRPFRRLFDACKAQLLASRAH